MRPDWREAVRSMHVVIYTANWCGYCRQAKSFMSANGVSYEEHDVEASQDDARAMRRLNPRGGLPTIAIDGHVMVGFSERSFVSLVQGLAR
jgi:glutaredoxin